MKHDRCKAFSQYAFAFQDLQKKDRKKLQQLPQKGISCQE